MGVDLRPTQNLLIANVFTPKSRIAQIETLFIGKSIDRLRSRFPLEAVFISRMSHRQAALVGNIFAQSEMSVGMNRIDNHNRIIL